MLDNIGREDLGRKREERHMREVVEVRLSSLLEMMFFLLTRSTRRPRLLVRAHACTPPLTSPGARTHLLSKRHQGLSLFSMRSFSVMYNL